MKEHGIDERIISFTAPVDGSLKEALKVSDVIKEEIKTYCAEHEIESRYVIVNLMEMKATPEGVFLKYVISRRVVEE